MNSCQMCPLKQLFAPTIIAVIVRLWNFWPSFALGPGCYGRDSRLWFWLCAPLLLHCLPVDPGRYGRSSCLSWFSRRKKTMQKWSRGHFEATKKAHFSILKPNFWSGDTGTTQTESTSRAIFCKIAISFGEILIFTSIVLGGFFLLQFFQLNFLLFHNGIVCHAALPG